MERKFISKRILLFMIAKLMETPLFANPGESLTVRTGCPLAISIVFSRLPLSDEPRNKMWHSLILEAGTALLTSDVTPEAGKLEPLK